MDKIDGMTMNIEQANVEKLKEIFPEVFADGKVDFDKLQGLLGNYIATDNEKYSFTWKGKTDSLRLAQKRSTGTLRPSMEDSKNWDTTQNLYLEGDNLEVLKLLQSSYLNSVKMIYIDPPYNTGHDFVYNDSFADPIAQYKEVTGQATRSNPETAGRYHTNWLNMMYPRLKLARNLLTDDGVIFISIDDNEQANLKKICDEVFGEDNLIASLIWDLGTGTTAGHFTRGHEYILCYAKKKDCISNFENNKSDEVIRHGALKKISKKNPATDITFPEGFEFDGVDAEFEGELGGSEKEYILNGKMTFVNGRLTQPVTIRAGFAMKKQVEDFIAGKEVFDTKGQPVKRFYFNSKGILFYEKEKTVINPRTVLSNIANTKNGTSEVVKLFGAKYFDFPKAVALIRYLIKLLTKKESVILDFFSGSATTAHAVMQLNAEDGGNRKFICVQLPEKTDEQSEAYKAGYTNICEIGKERIRRAGEKIKQDNKDKQGIENLDIGFKVFKLDSSNLVKWDNTPTTDVEEVKKRVQQSLFYLVEGREDIDLVYEVMLKRGLPLTSTVEECVFDGVKAFFVNSPSDKMLICLDPVTISAVEKMAESTAEVCIFADRCFADANILSNTDEILKKKDKKVEMF